MHKQARLNLMEETPLGHLDEVKTGRKLKRRLLIRVIDGSE